MFGRRRVVQNKAVAELMTRFFRAGTQVPGPEGVARAYGNFLWNNETQNLTREKELSRSRFSVGLAVQDSTTTFAQLTKRAALVCDTLLLSHDWTGEFHDLTVPTYMLRGLTEPRRPLPVGGTAIEIDVGSIRDSNERTERNKRSRTYGMFCPDLNGLGQWIIDAKPLLKAGLAWYLPSYSTAELRMSKGTKQVPRGIHPEQVKAIDYLIKDGRAVDASGAEPVKSQLVRPVLHTELPFLSGVGLPEFSKITVGEFDSYSAFRDFLRQSLLELDTALNATEADREMLKLGLRINDQVRAAHAELAKVGRKRAVAASGAALGSVAAVLVAVYGPALQAAITALGLSGGVWGIINAAADNNTKALREDKWYYVWALAEEGRRA